MRQRGGELRKGVESIWWARVSRGRQNRSLLAEKLEAEQSTLLNICSANERKGATVVLQNGSSLSQRARAMHHSKALTSALLLQLELGVNYDSSLSLRGEVQGCVKPHETDSNVTGDAEWFCCMHTMLLGVSRD
eukprot:6173769-Pleurochrysis_carterae.AAC.1